MTGIGEIAFRMVVHRRPITCSSLCSSNTQRSQQKWPIHKLRYSLKIRHGDMKHVIHQSMLFIGFGTFPGDGCWWLSRSSEKDWESRHIWRVWSHCAISIYATGKDMTWKDTLFLSKTMLLGDWREDWRRTSSTSSQKGGECTSIKGSSCQITTGKGLCCMWLTCLQHRLTCWGHSWWDVSKSLKHSQSSRIQDPSWTKKSGW